MKASGTPGAFFMSSNSPSLSRMRLTLIFLLISGLFSCKSNKLDPVGKIEEGSVEFKYAEHVKIDQEGDSYKVRIYNPDDKKLESSFTFNPDSTYKIISLSSTTNGMLSAIGESDQIYGISDLKYVNDPEIKERYKSGVIKSYGESTSQSVEKIIASEADIVFYSSFGEKFPNEDQLKKLGVIVIPLYDWREEKALGKAEWIKLVGCLLGRIDEADSFFTGVEERYTNLVELASKPSMKPIAIAGNIYGDVWYAPAGDSFGAQLIENAGGAYVYETKEGSGSVAISMEQILIDNETTKIWLNPGFKTKAEVLKNNPHADKLPSFDKMYCYSGKMDYYWERSAIEPDLLLSDLIKIFHPELRRDADFNFYQKVD
jgi:iron complex transport system substrate-binding protein